MAADAPPVIGTSLPRLRSTHDSEATGLDETVVVRRQAVEGGPVRIDLFSSVRDVEDQMMVATAILLPVGTRARFMDNKQKELFAAENPGDVPGRSILSLVIDGPEGVQRPGGPEVIFDATKPRRPQSVDPDDDGLPPGMSEMLDPGPTAVRELKPRRPPTAGGRELRDQLGAPSAKRAPAASRPFQPRSLSTPRWGP